MKYRYMCVCLAVSVMYASEEQKIEKTLAACKRETFGTSRTSALDPFIKKRIETLRTTDPQGYEKLVAYEQKKRTIEKKKKQKENTKVTHDAHS